MGLEGQLPPDARIPCSPRKHKIPIAIQFTVMIFTGGFIPIILYFALHYAAKTSDAVAVSVPSAIFGVFALFQLFVRQYSLMKKSSTTRPIGGTRGQLDYFQWNFIVGFIYITVVISIGSSVGSLSTKLRVVCMGQLLLMYQVCLQMVIGLIMNWYAIGYPFRFSSMPKGAIMRTASYTIIEDLIAVDAKQGTDGFRKPWNRRWESSAIFQQHLKRMDMLWGISGSLVATALVLLVWLLPNAEVSYCLGWLIPWAWAAPLAYLTVKMTDNMLKRERAYFESLPESA